MISLKKTPFNKNSCHQQTTLRLTQVADVWSGHSHQTQTNFESTSCAVDNNLDRDESPRSYSPYLIEYHKETNTFTYNDPWVVVDEPTDCCSHDECEIVLNTESNDETTDEIQKAHDDDASVTIEPPTKPETNDGCDETNDNGTESTKTNSSCPPDETVVEHVPKVSSPPHQQNNNE